MSIAKKRPVDVEIGDVLHSAHSGSEFKIVDIFGHEGVLTFAIEKPHGSVTRYVGPNWFKECSE
jgi:hypothetical protein